MNSVKRFWTIPELGEKLIVYLDPLSLLRLAQSEVMEKEVLQKSLTFKAWSELIRRSSLEDLGRWEEKKGDVKILVKILHFMKTAKLSPFLMALLDLICESRHGGPVIIMCPCRPEPHSISTDAFLLLEEVEAAFGTTEQRLKSIVSDFSSGDLISAISTRMSRQENEIVTSIHLMHAEIKDKSSVEAFIPLLQTEVVSVRRLDLRRAEFAEEDWQALAGALRGKPKVCDWVDFSRENLEEAGDSMKDIWDATRNAFIIQSMHYGCAVYVQKPKYDWENASTKLKQISGMTEDEFDAHCEEVWREDPDTGYRETEGEGQEGGEDEESDDEDHDGDEEG